MQELIKAIEMSIPLVVDNWNDVKIKQFEILYEQPFAEYFRNRQTQEKTKVVSPVIDTVFARIMSEKINNFIVDEGKGRDYRWNEKPLENKLTLSTGNSWTGNGYRKTDFHILSKFELEENGMIISFFTCLVNLSECVSQWTKPKNSNFSTLKFLSCDFDKITPIHGKIIKSSKKYLDYEMIK